MQFLPRVAPETQILSETASVLNPCLALCQRLKSETQPAKNHETMKSIIRRFTLCALLGASTSVQAAEVLMPNGDFSTPGGAMWQEVNGGATIYEYPTTGGNPSTGGYGIIDGTNSPWAIWVGNADSAIPIGDLGLTAGQTYTFKQDMKILSGSNVGGFKIDFVPAGSTGDLRIPKIGDGSTWETYSYSISIPAGTTGLKIVPLWGPSSRVGYDNFRVENGAVPPPPVIPGIPNPGFETPGGASWTAVGPLSGFSYPTTGGNPGGYGIMDASNGQWGIWVANGDSPLTLAQLSLTAGNTYNFTMDMKLLSGSSIGGFKVDFVPAGSTGDLRVPMIGDGSTWQTYTYPVAIPPGTTSIKLVPLWGPNSSVGYDNIAVNTTPIVPPPIIPVVLNGGFEIPGGSGWAFFNDGPTISYPAAGGNPNGHAVINATVGGNFGVLVAFNNSEVTAASLGLTPGETYTFQVDMKILEGANIGGLRLEGPAGFAVEQRPTLIGDGSQWATYSIPFTLQNGANPVTQFKLVALWGFNSSVAYDNFKILLPAPAGPLQASIAQGTSVSWTASSTVNSYQPQESADNSSWTNLGSAFVGNTVNAVFDDSPSPFYRVLESQPSVLETIYNGNFAEEGLFDDEAEGWNPVGSQVPSRLLTGGRGDNGACMQIQAVNLGLTPTNSEIQQNTNTVFDHASGEVVPGNTYSFSFWAKQISVGPSYVQQFKVSFLSGTGAIMGDGGWQNFSGPVGGAWTLVSQNGLVAPAGASSALIQIFGATGAVEGGFGEVLIDDVSLQSTGFGSPSVLAASKLPAVEISWPSKVGQTYQVESSTNLVNWSNFGGVITGDNSIKSVYDTMGIPSKFYKVGELP
jgi:hypothetical protein